LSKRERLLRAARFERPDRIPVTMGINNACWHHYPQEALEALMAEHPLLFPNFTPQLLPIKPAYAHWRIAGRLYTDTWGCVWETVENGITGAVSRPALPRWEAFDSYPPPDPETQNWWGRARLAAGVCAHRAGARVRECGDLVQGSLRHGHTFLTLS